MRSDPVRWPERAAPSPPMGLSAVGAKWRREVPPPRRLTVREQSLPWASFSLAAPPRRVNRPPWRAPPAAGTPAAGGACSRAVNAGSCRDSPRRVTAAPPVKPPPAAGGAGVPRNATGPPPTANNAAATRPDGTAAVGENVGPVPSRSHRPRLIRRAIASPDRRGPAPRRNPGRIPGPALRPAGLLHRVPPHAAVPPATLLFLLLPPGLTTRPPARSPTPEATAGGWSAAMPPSPWTARRGSVHVVTY